MTTKNGNGSRLALAQRGRLKAPLRVIVYGPEGVGKTTLAASAPSPLWLDIEDGSGRLDIARYPFRDGDGGHVPQSYAEILAALDDIAAHESGYKTLVIDTADRLESLMWRWMIERDQPQSKIRLTNIESYGYGKGYTQALDEWRALCVRLDRIRAARGMAIVFLAHAQIRPFKNPTGDDYDRYNLRINDKAAGLLKEWADVTGFACFEEGATSMDGDRPRGYSTGRRLLKLERTAAYDAKSRYALPAELELDPSNPWAPFARAMEEAVDRAPAELAAAISAEVERIGDADTAARVKPAVELALKASDAAALHRYLISLKNRPSRASTPKEEASHG